MIVADIVPVTQLYLLSIYFVAKSGKENADFDNKTIVECWIWLSAGTTQHDDYNVMWWSLIQ